MSVTKPANGPAVATAQATPQTEDAAILDRVVQATEARRFSLEEIRYMAECTEKSRLFGVTQAQAFVLMMVAEARGLHPIEALQRYHVIHNRPSMSAAAKLAEMQARGWVCKWDCRDSDSEEQAAWWSHTIHNPEPVRIGFTREQAELAELNSDVWRHYPSAMLRSRAISVAVTMLDPGVALGMYTPEEIADMSDAKAAPPPPQPPPPKPRPPKPEPLPEEPAARSGPPKPAGEIQAWIQEQVDQINLEWVADDGGRENLVADAWQAINGMMTDWIKHQVIQESDILVDGKRSKARMRSILKAKWEEKPHGLVVKQGIGGYLQAKLEKARAKDAEPAEETANATA